MSLKLLNIKPLTQKQEAAFDGYTANKSLFLYGSAKTGKTWLALYFALRDLIDHSRPIVIVRSAVPTREIGYLKGTLEEKIAVYERPYRDIVTTLLASHMAYDNLKAAESIVFMTTSHIRGLTLSGCTLIVDEVQNCTFHEIDSIMTRVGFDVRVILCGDHVQSDLRACDTGFKRLLRVVLRMDSFSCVEFFPDDIVGSQLAKEWLLAKYALDRRDKSVSSRATLPAFLVGGDPGGGGEVVRAESAALSVSNIAAGPGVSIFG